MGFEFFLFSPRRKWAGQPPPALDSSMGLVLQGMIFSSLSPSQRERQRIKMLLFPWHRSTQLRGCLAGARDLNEPRQLTLVWTGGMTSSDAVNHVRWSLPLGELNLPPAMLLSFRSPSGPAVFTVPVMDPPLPKLGLQYVSSYSHSLGFSPVCSSPLGEIQTNRFCP